MFQQQSVPAHWIWADGLLSDGMNVMSEENQNERADGGRLFCKSGGCTAKLGAGLLSAVLSKIPKGAKDPNLLVGYDSHDDAAVYRITDDIAVVQTVDFFPPMVEDPYTFGQIAAANALSDIYAMGGCVKTALNILCCPETMDLNTIGAVMQGGSSKVLEADGTLAGGHSVHGDTLLYGLSVFGTVNPLKMWTNTGAQAGDRLILTKKLGTGLVCAAHRAGEVTEEDKMSAAGSVKTLHRDGMEHAGAGAEKNLAAAVRSGTALRLDETEYTGAGSEENLAAAIRSMTTLNRRAAETAAAFTVHACTDVTGFGFLGHLHEMMGGGHSGNVGANCGTMRERTSAAMGGLSYTIRTDNEMMAERTSAVMGGLSCTIRTDHIVALPGALEAADAFLLTGGSAKNRRYASPFVTFRENVSFAMKELLFDPQTSGGLLFAVPADEADALENALLAQRIPARIVGVVEERRDCAQDEIVVE